MWICGSSMGGSPRENTSRRGDRLPPAAAEEFPFGMAVFRHQILGIPASFEILVEKRIRASDIARHQSGLRGLPQLAAAVEVVVFLESLPVILLSLREFAETEVYVAQ